MTMMRPRAKSLPEVKTSWTHVAQRTLWQFTHVNNTETPQRHTSYACFGFRKKRPALLKMKIKRRTQADGCQETQGDLWRKAGGEERLQDVDRKGEGDHGLARRVDHQHSDPQAQEAKGE